MPRPVLQAMVLADHVYQDRLSGKFIISGTFGRISMRAPTTQPQAPQFQPPAPISFSPPPPSVSPPIATAHFPAASGSAAIAPSEPLIVAPSAPDITVNPPNVASASPTPPPMVPPPAAPLSAPAPSPPPVLPSTTPQAPAPIAPVPNVPVQPSAPSPVQPTPPAPVQPVPRASEPLPTRPTPPTAPPGQPFSPSQQQNTVSHSLDTAAALISVSGSPYLYLALTGIHGKIALTIQFVNQADGDALFQAVLEVMAADPVAVAEYCVPLPQLPVTKPGVYSVDLLYGGEILGSWRLIASTV
jgi:hypothetical protein